MIVRTLEDVKKSSGYRENPGLWSSARYLLEADGVGFTLTQTTLAAGSEQTLEYKHHIEANLVIEGTGSVTEVRSGITHPLNPGSLYTLDKNDRHTLLAKTDMRLVCVFLPALVGNETHDKDGSYPATTSVSQRA